MISDKTRKTISNATLAYIILSIITSFAGNLTNNTTLLGIILGVEIISIGCLIWLAYGFRSFYNEEKTFNLKLTFILVTIAAILELLTTVAYLTVNMTIPENKIVSKSVEAALASSFIIYFVAFIFLKVELDRYVVEKRNLFKGQLSLPLGYIFRATYSILTIIKPISEIIVKTAEGKYEILSGWENYFAAVSFFQISYVFFIIIGYWNLRRAIILLDRVPPSLLMPQAPQPYPTQLNPNFVYQQPSVQKPMAEEQTISDTTTEEKPEPQETNKKKKMLCVKCGLELEPDAKYCSNCGAENPYIV